ncbi:MAG: MBL fold metallo-hydrolase [Selenomonas sp.]|uniref:MBL fold metallo-hydrolase n=1 Tax=Selenomonas sp. TaxID=2053611 RepID=UPI0025D1325A|nr:MBL fold metallo-hydrolase [Selenomonas sp.]MCR5756547.1 MBL fold metallo-hydrolase [Selenomonas sp.]
MMFDSVLTRRSFFKGGLALTASLFFDFPQFCAARERFPRSPEEAVGETAMHYLFDRTPIEPVKVFDNLYYIGAISVAQFVIRTSDGLIMIDSGWDEKDADYAAVSMERLGLSPADTRYILVTHGHSDHYGGAQFFKDKYAPQAMIGLNVIDSNWNSVIPPEGAFSGLRPQIDIELHDRQTITLGDTSIFLVLTPGHTPGCMSMIVPVTDNGEKHNVAIWGGTGTPSNLEMNYLYLSAVHYFARYTCQYQVDVEMSAHGWVDDTFARLEQLRHRQPGDPHPFVIGEEKYRQYENIFKKMAEEAIKKYTNS